MDQAFSLLPRRVNIITNDTLGGSKSNSKSCLNLKTLVVSYVVSESCPKIETDNSQKGPN